MNFNALFALLNSFLLKDAFFTTYKMADNPKLYIRILLTQNCLEIE